MQIYILKSLLLWDQRENEYVKLKIVDGKKGTRRGNCLFNGTGALMDLEKQGSYLNTYRHSLIYWTFVRIHVILTNGRLRLQCFS